MNMSNLEIEGRIIQKMAVASGQSGRGPWKKQDFVVEYQNGSYPAQVLFTAFGENNVAELDRFGVGDMVRVSFNIRAREYNGRWYNDVRMWKIAPAQQAPSQQGPVQQQAPAPKIEDMPAETDSSEDDMPF